MQITSFDYSNDSNKESKSSDALESNHASNSFTTKAGIFSMQSSHHNKVRNFYLKMKAHHKASTSFNFI